MTNEPNGIGLAHTGGIERPQPARVAYETAEDIQDQFLNKESNGTDSD